MGYLTKEKQSKVRDAAFTINRNPNLHFLMTEWRNYDIFLLQGGTRSGKTYSTVIFLVRLCLQYSGMTITIARKTFPALRGSVLRDFLEILNRLEMYDPAMHNKSEHTYTLNGNLIEFISIDNPLKIQGRKRDILYFNEAIEMDKESWFQLAVRTTGKIILDYNPAPFHFLYDDILPREDAACIVTTYKDNPFLSERQVREIERTKNADPNRWKIFGLGERGETASAIYTHWSLEDNFLPTDWMYGIDLGNIDPTAVVRVGLYDGRLYWQQLMCESIDDFNTRIAKVEQVLNQYGRNKRIFSDHTRDFVNAMKSKGYNIDMAYKDVAFGIDLVKSYPLIITSDSTDMIEEIKYYTYKTDAKGKLVYPLKPVEVQQEHTLDAARYASVALLNTSKKGFTGYTKVKKR